MKERASAVSPFAALDTREQMEQWIWWQCQRPPQTEDTNTAAVQQTVEKEPVQAAPLPTIHHGQYDAVIRRMSAAGRQAGAYRPCTESL